MSHESSRSRIVIYFLSGIILTTVEATAGIRLVSLKGFCRLSLGL